MSAELFKKRLQEVFEESRLATGSIVSEALSKGVHVTILVQGDHQRSIAREYFAGLVESGFNSSFMCIRNLEGLQEHPLPDGQISVRLSEMIMPVE